jgi:3-dehydroquinate dehydratase
VIELRLDCLDDNQLEDALARLTEIVAKTLQPFIITNRPARGREAARTLDAHERLDFWRVSSELLRDD